ncbi:helix-turn-helix transcriptional regulator [Frateuria sp. MAH-13]|uniref:Helix-turn-helix transcriptional regulator n=1 Tax=Frateuria flava TaxID=2821489 RepID=A0ABS4DQX9_9GAMM|nr:helix-turn-helix transcriptional regulator [Frateuria flava]MBP1475348.1 helix-turn-helix transcriptional regulator [Frateuria flava]
MDVIRLPNQLGPKLRAARMQRGMTQADVARQLGISSQAVSKLENNAGQASFDRVHRLCLLLGLELGLQEKSTGTPKTVKSTTPAKAAW